MKRVTVEGINKNTHHMTQDNKEQLPEEWRVIPGHDGYKASIDGRLFSMLLNREIKTRLNGQGYPEATLRVNGVQKAVRVHRMVALAYIPNPENKSTINHKDGVKTNNHANNLEWNTIQENIAHATIHGLMNSGERVWNHKMTDEVFKQILADKQAGLNFKQLSAKYNIERGIIFRHFRKNKIPHINSSEKRIGSGTNMSVPVAALIFFFQECKTDHLTYRHEEAINRIMEIAGVKKDSFRAAAQVTNRLGKSPFWTSEYIPNLYKNIRGHGGANIFRPSDKGHQHYKTYLQNI